MRNSVVIDSLVGILAEYIIVTLAVILYGLYEGLGSGLRADDGMGKSLLTGVLMNLLWVYATFMVQVLLLGNLCGLAGWFLLRKRTAVRR